MKWFTVTQLGEHTGLTPEGYYVAEGVVVARCGQQIYHHSELPLEPNQDGFVSVHRDPSEVFHPKSIASFETKPIVNDHPMVEVGPGNFNNLAIGVMTNPRRGKGANDDALLADLTFFSPVGIALVQNGKRAVSVGYDAHYEQIAPGMGRQKNIVCNHLALVDIARCGARCTILDNGLPLYNDDGEWNEADHPREDDGKFTEGGGGGGAEQHPIHTLEGAQALVDKLSEQYPDSKHPQYPVEGPHRVEVRPDDYGDEVSVGQHRGGHVYLTPKYWNKEFLEKHGKEMLGVMHDTSPEGIVTHEFGHALANKLEQIVDPYTIWDIVHKWVGAKPGEKLAISNELTSPYGQENMSEFLAESFTAFHNGKLSVDPYGGESHPFHASQKATAEGVWKEMLDYAKGPKLPRTQDSARYIGTMYNMETEYSTERLQAAADLLKDSAKRGDGKIRARIAKELKARAKAPPVADDDWTRDVDWVEEAA